MEEKWFDDSHNLAVSIGLEFDAKMTHADITSSLKENNNGMCSICFCEFDEDGVADSLVCGHQYCSVCWGDYLKNKINSDG